MNSEGSFGIVLLRHKVIVWGMLCFLVQSLYPFVGMAQPVSATLLDVTGRILINDQEQGEGTLLKVGDTIEVLTGGTALLQMSDGSTLEIGENTKITLTELGQTRTNTRISRLKLAWGWIRAKLSPGHQGEGAVFSIETPNAVIGVKFSQPDIEVSYNPATQETIGLAHTVELLAKNLLTNEEMLVPVASTVIITATAIKVIAGITEIIGTTGTGSTSANPTSIESSNAGSSGIGTGTKVALGIGAAAAAGGVAAFVIMKEAAEDGGECPLNGPFIDVYMLSNGETVYATEKGNCDIMMSYGEAGWSQADADIALSEYSFAVRLNSTTLSPNGAAEKRLDNRGMWHIDQWFQTGELQKGSYGAEGIFYRTNQYWFTRNFTIQVD